MHTYVTCLSKLMPSLASVPLFSLSPFSQFAVVCHPWPHVRLPTEKKLSTILLKNIRHLCIYNLYDLA